MKDQEDSSSNDDAVVNECSIDSTKNLQNDMQEMIINVVERLTKISVLCESHTTKDSNCVKSLMKHMHKFERDIHKLHEQAQVPKDGSDNVYKGAVRAVDNYQNPYDWAYKAIIQKHNDSGRKLDHSLESVDALQKALIDRLQINKFIGSATQTQVTEDDPTGKGSHL
ncbi:hypothetical protein X943_003290 [Babesia divergens]|uniref:Mediator of RNA polymerase II transcription subunit 10 n=1 Tax=Babesia divergens TaxID=32595 RepID=A0AAD9LFX9_BABDI|nr:hypothetical protein X943_003290 [Babesia divergens]